MGEAITVTFPQKVVVEKPPFEDILKFKFV
jgi:hypothetical protein